jgi:hypothetical protein
VKELPTVGGSVKNGSPTKAGRKLKKAPTSVSEPDLSVGGGRARSPQAAKKRTKPPSTASSSESGAVATSPTKTNGVQKRSRSQGKPSVADSSSGGGDATSGDLNGGKKTATFSPRKTAARGSSDAIFSDEETDYTRLGMSSRRKTYLDVLALERDRRERKKKSGAAADSSEDGGGGENSAVLFDRNGRRIRKVMNARRFSYFVGLENFFVELTLN